MADYTMQFCIGCVALQTVGYATGTVDLNMKSIIAGVIVALGLSVMSNVDERISTGLAAIMFFTLAIEILPDIMGKIGLDSTGIKDMSPEKKTDTKYDQSTTKPDISGSATVKPASAPTNSQFTPEKVTT